MVTNLKSLIIQQIRDAFGSVKVYNEPVRQGLMTPAFLVLIADNTQTTGLNVVERNYTVNVNYFPRALDERRSECDSVLETFQTEFRRIGTKYHSHNIEGSVSDDVLVITFNVRVLLREVVDGIKMQTLEVR